MAGSGTLALIAAAAIFLLFFTNVTFGAIGRGVFLSDVAEMLTLFTASALFAIGVLQREARRNAAKKATQKD